MKANCYFCGSYLGKTVGGEYFCDLLPQSWIGFSIISFLNNLWNSQTIGHGTIVVGGIINNLYSSLVKKLLTFAGSKIVEWNYLHFFFEILKSCACFEINETKATTEKAFSRDHLGFWDNSKSEKDE